MHHVISAMVKRPRLQRLFWLCCVMNDTCCVFFRAVCCRVWAFPRLAVSRHAVCTLLLGVCCPVEQRPWGTPSDQLLATSISTTLCPPHIVITMLLQRANSSQVFMECVSVSSCWLKLCCVSVGGEKLLPGSGISEVGPQSTHPTRWSRAFKSGTEGWEEKVLLFFRSTCNPSIFTKQQWSWCGRDFFSD